MKISAERPSGARNVDLRFHRVTSYDRRGNKNETGAGEPNTPRCNKHRTSSLVARLNCASTLSRRLGLGPRNEASQFARGIELLGEFMISLIQDTRSFGLRNGFYTELRGSLERKSRERHRDGLHSSTQSSLDTTDYVYPSTTFPALVLCSSLL